MTGLLMNDDRLCVYIKGFTESLDILDTHAH